MRAIFERTCCVCLLLTWALVSPEAGAADLSRPTTVIVVRHAEKVDESRDPALSEAGMERARALARVLEHAGLDVVYASQYQRARLTAMPAAEAAGLAVRIDPVEGDVDAWAQGFAALLARGHAGQAVLVVGHSNTVPPLVTALCRCDVEPLTDDDYDRVYVVHAAGRDNPDLIVARYGSHNRRSEAQN